ncbi:hypothetical protein MKZ38_002845 [Zalerion maritima]|uniref:Uncharacterized protein n=1 Tax=Zalerion maritima TaxID=339359 RepID=A0AAD5WWQ2_9PEZI|nr:hypothetical protein MKZ38_002845 [Zalerion maritima]
MSPSHDSNSSVPDHDALSDLPQSRCSPPSESKPPPLEGGNSEGYERERKTPDAEDSSAAYAPKSDERKAQGGEKKDGERYEKEKKPFNWLPLLESRDGSGKMRTEEQEER